MNVSEKWRFWLQNYTAQSSDLFFFLNFCFKNLQIKSKFTCNRNIKKTESAKQKKKTKKTNTHTHTKEKENTIQFTCPTSISTNLNFAIVRRLKFFAD